jgi:methionine aminopeptidase
VRRGRPVRIALPDVKTAGGVADALATVVTAMGDGTLTPEEAASVAAVIETRRRAIETVELEARLLSIEEALKSHGQAD